MVVAKTSSILINYPFKKKNKRGKKKMVIVFTTFLEER